MIKLMVSVHILILMEQNMKVIGRMIFNMDLVSKNVLIFKYLEGLMVQVMRGSIRMEKNMEKVNIHGVMKIFMMGIGWKIELRDMYI